MVSLNNFLDLYDLFVNEISGSPWIFVFLSTICIILLGAYFRMPNGVVFFIMVLWFLILSAFFGEVILAFTLLIVSFFIGWQIIKLLRG